MVVTFVRTEPAGWWRFFAHGASQPAMHVTVGQPVKPPHLTGRLCTLSMVATLALAGCAGGETGGSGIFAAVDLTGGGSSLINPIMAKWATDYAALTGVRVNYQSIGSGGGIRQLSELIVDFGATDSPMTAREAASARGGEVLHIPIIVGSVVIAYNLPEVSQPIRLTGEIVSEMYLGGVVKWNDPRIAALNPEVTLPDRDVLPVYRTDGSGTTFIFTSFLGSTSSRWSGDGAPGVGKSVRWTRGVGLGGKGNEGVAMLIKDTPGAVGYTEYAYATQTHLAMAPIRNSAGDFVAPSVDATIAAADAALLTMPDNSDLTLQLLNQPHPDAYPIAAFSWLLIYEQPRDSVRARKLADFVRWVVTEGDSQARALDYAPIPPRLAAIVLERMERISPTGSGIAEALVTH